jgi:hypothetical protein
MNSSVVGEVVSAVLGQVLGELDGDVDGDLDGVGRSRGGRRGGALLRLPPKPAWRDGIVTPGVNGPREGKEPLPLVADLNNGTFSSTVTAITFQARPQQPYHPQRLLAQVLRTGTTAAGLAAVCQGVFVGTILQQAQLGSFNLEFFSPTAFDVMLNCSPASAGIDVKLPVVLTGGLTSPDTINVQLLFLGQTLR